MIVMFQDGPLAGQFHNVGTLKNEGEMIRVASPELADMGKAWIYSLGEMERLVAARTWITVATFVAQADSAPTLINLMVPLEER